MSEKLLVKNPVYPIIGLLSSVLIIVFGLITAKNTACIFFLGTMWLLFLLFGYWRSCFAVVTVAAVFAGITFLDKPLISLLAYDLFIVYIYFFF